MKVVRATVVDYDAGNILSITRALEVAGASVTVATCGADLEGIDLVIVPGVGASAPAMRRLRRNGLDRAIVSAIDGGAWYLGVCLGLELLYETSDEDGARCLGLLPGRVVAIPNAPRMPHIGWNTVDVVRPHPMFEGIGRNAPAYFVHSYVAEPSDETTVLATTEFGGRFPSVVASGRIVGVQFHPERSGVDGLQLLSNLVALAGGESPEAHEAAILAGAA
jgi:glutamine amidotransferase